MRLEDMAKTYVDYQIGKKIGERLATVFGEHPWTVTLALAVCYVASLVFLARTTKDDHFDMGMAIILGTLAVVGILFNSCWAANTMGKRSHVRIFLKALLAIFIVLYLVVAGICLAGSSFKYSIQTFIIGIVMLTIPLAWAIVRFAMTYSESEVYARISDAASGVFHKAADSASVVARDAAQSAKEKATESISKARDRIEERREERQVRRMAEYLGVDLDHPRGKGDSHNAGGLSVEGAGVDGDADAGAAEGRSVDDAGDMDAVPVGSGGGHARGGRSNEQVTSCQSDRAGDTPCVVLSNREHLTVSS